MKRSESGMSLVGVLMGASVLSVVILGSMSLMQMVTKQQSKNNLDYQVDQIRKNLQFVINDPNSWTATKNGNTNSSFACLANHTPCTTDGQPGGRPLTGIAIPRIIQSNGTVVHDSTSTSSGYTMGGVACAEFNAGAGAGSGACPLRIETTWSAVCTAPCIDPMIQIRIVPQYNPDGVERMPFSPAKLTAEFYQGSSSAALCDWQSGAGTLSQNCANVGIGMLNPMYGLVVEKTNVPNGQGWSALFRDSAGAQGVLIGSRGTTAANAVGTIQGINGPLSAGTSLSLNPYGGNVGVGKLNPFVPLDVLSSGPGVHIRAPYNHLYMYDTNSGPNVAPTIKFNVDSGWFLLQIVGAAPEYDSVAAGMGTPWAVGLDGTSPYFGRTIFQSDVFVGPYGARVGDNGDMYIPFCGCWLSSRISDIRTKDNIVELATEAGLKGILQLRPVTFDWKDTERREKSGRQMGFIAQEVQRLYPEAVETGDIPWQIKTDHGLEDVVNPKSLRYEVLVVPLVKSVQELNGMMKRLEKENAELKTALCELHPKLKLCTRSL